MRKRKIDQAKAETTQTENQDDLLVNELIMKRKLQQDALIKIISSMDKIKNSFTAPQAGNKTSRKRNSANKK